MSDLSNQIILGHLRQQSNSRIKLVRNVARKLLTVFGSSADKRSVKKSRFVAKLEKLNIAEIVALASQTKSLTKKYYVAEFLFNFCHFKSAKTILSELPLESFPHIYWLKIGVILSSVGPNERSDEFLRKQIACATMRLVNLANFNIALVWINKSGLSYDERLSAYDFLEQKTNEKSIDDLKFQKQLLFSKAALNRAHDIEIDSLELFDLRSGNVESAEAHLPLVLQLIREGRAEHAMQIVDSLSKNTDLAGLDARIEKLRHFPNKIDINEFQVPQTFSAQIRLMRSLGANQNFSQGFKNLISACADALVQSYPNLTLLQRDQALRALIAVEHKDHAARALANSPPRTDIHAPERLLKAWHDYESSNFSRANEHFLHLFKENPHWDEVRSGLWFTLARTGNNFREFLNVSKDAGVDHDRMRPVSIEKTWTMWSENKFAELFAERLKNPIWALLKAKYGERFITNSMPKNSKTKSLFFIADQGVGDEMRCFKYYSFLQNNFAQVVATCDPRLEKILKLNFPKIHFVPVWRTRIGLVSRIGKLDKRLLGFNGLFYNTLAEATKLHFDRCDYIMSDTFLQLAEHCGMLSVDNNAPSIRVPSAEQRSDKKATLRVGVLWRSSFTRKNRDLLYPPLQHFSKLFALKGVEFHSLQYAMTEEEKTFCDLHGLIDRDDIDKYNDFEKLSNYLVSFDLVIGISTATVELAAALGVETWYMGYSPENLLTRTGGGLTEIDKLSANTKIISATNIDFSEPESTCIEKVIDEIFKRMQLRLENLVLNH